MNYSIKIINYYYIINTINNTNDIAKYTQPHNTNTRTKKKK